MYILIESYRWSELENKFCVSFVTRNELQSKVFSSLIKIQITNVNPLSGVFLESFSLWYSERVRARARENGVLQWTKRAHIIKLCGTKAEEKGNYVNGRTKEN